MVILGKTMHRAHSFCFALVLFAAPLCLARDLAVIVNRSNPTSTVTAAELAKILKASAQSWPDGKKIRVFLTGLDFGGTSVILQRACKMKPEEVKNLADAHKADLQVVGSDEIVLQMVDSNPGAIGIVNVYSINSHVKVLKVDEKLPMEPGYGLHSN